MVDVDSLAYSLGRGLRRGVDKLNSLADENSERVADFASKVATGVTNGMEDAGKQPTSTQPRQSTSAQRQSDHMRDIVRWNAAIPDSERGDGRGVAVDLAVRLPDGGNRITRPCMVNQPDRSAVAVMAEIMAAKLGAMAPGGEVRKLEVSPTAIAVLAVQTGVDDFVEVTPLAVVHSIRVPAVDGGQLVPYNPYDKEWPWASGDTTKWKYMAEDLAGTIGA